MRVKSFLTAVQYFTRIPVPAWVGHSPEQLRRAARYFPAVGIVVGLCGAGVVHVAALVFPAPLPVLLSVVATIWMTGAFHEDGVADTFDGLGGGATRERALAIMKDSRLGTYGTIALVLTLLLKIAALNAMPTALACAALIGAHPFSRWLALTLVHRLAYVSDADQSRARPLVEHMSSSELCFAAIFGLAPLTICTGWIARQSPVAAAIWIGAGAFVALGVLVFLARWFVRRIGGYTGDTLGATQQLTEAACYLGFLAACRSF
jgi:adenosylcobinamide-GDP ribazoletransferase